MADLFAPPTKEEISSDNLFSPPTHEELAIHVNALSPDMGKTPTMGEAIVRGWGRGATGGIGPSIEGAIAAPLAKYTDLGDPEDKHQEFMDLFRKYRGLYQRRNENVATEYPRANFISNAVGGAQLMSSIPLTAPVRGDLGMNMAKGAIAGGGLGFGYSKADLSNPTSKNIAGAVADTATGTLVGAGSAAAAEGITQGAQRIGLTNALGKNSLGGTRAQMENVDPNIGDKMFERDMIPFFSGPGKIGRNAQRAADLGGQQMGQAMSALDEAGVTVPHGEIEDAVTHHAENLVRRNGAAYRPAANHANEIISDQLLPELGGGMGEYEPPISAVDTARKGYGRLVSKKAWNNDPAVQQRQEGVKAVYRGLKDAVQNTADSADETLGNTYRQGKLEHGTFIGPAEIGQARQLQLDQHPIGGLLDMATAASSHSGNPLLDMAAVIGRRVVAPRLSSSVGNTLWKAPQRMQQALPTIIQRLQSNPSTQQYVGALQSAAQRGDAALASTHFLLQQVSGEYNEAVNSEQ